MPTVTDVERKRPIKIDAPLCAIEVQLGRLVATGKDGHAVEGSAGETIDAGPLVVPITLTTAEAPCRARIVYDSERAGYEAMQERTAERQAAKAAQGEAAASEVVPPRPPIH